MVFFCFLAMTRRCATRIARQWWMLRSGRPPLYGDGHCALQYPMSSSGSFLDIPGHRTSDGVAAATLANVCHKLVYPVNGCTSLWEQRDLGDAQRRGPD